MQIDKRHTPETFAKPKRDTTIVRRSTGTHYEDYKHPNLRTEISRDIVVPGVKTKQVEKEQPWVESSQNESEKGCMYFFRKFDDQILRPIFIHKYKYIRNAPEVNFEQVLKETEIRNNEIGVMLYNHSMSHMSNSYNKGKKPSYNSMITAQGYNANM